jgi:hypothetical protein
VGQWVSPAGNTPKYWFNFSNPRLVDWWVHEYIGQAVNESLFDGVYFDCSCGAPPGVPSADAGQFQADAQVAFDRGLALIKGGGKWASAWNSDGGLTQADCATTVRSWMVIGANSSLTLQALAPAFKTSRGERQHEAQAAPEDGCGTCAVTRGVDAESGGIVVPPIPTASEAECCAACHNITTCEAFVMGPCTTPVNCREGEPYCFLVSKVRGYRPSPNRASGCVRGKAPAAEEMARNNTVAAFLISRGESAMLEFPVAGAYEDMGMYASSPLLSLDFGTPQGPGEETSLGVFTRKWTAATVSLDCNSYTSSFAFTPPTP